MKHIFFFPIKDNAENSRGYYYALVFVTLISYCLSLAGISLLYIYFTQVKKTID